jgi:hypothetical protein
MKKPPQTVAFKNGERHGFNCEPCIQRRARLSFFMFTVSTKGVIILVEEKKEEEKWILSANFLKKVLNTAIIVTASPISYRSFL